MALSRRTRRRQLVKQVIAQRTRAKYGKAMRPSPVVIRRLDTGQVVRVMRQDEIRYQRARKGEYSSRKNYGGNWIHEVV